ncbi:FimD/PapC C-terminal domain-containing protein [Providencia stuartii]|uniref:FimD/PapC C-terminal domain-containing protein n=2 Tax=Morganellaceae TaxID=1903414 RepID=UPI002989C508|nr:FimD/PapC C-terminal domain-containing protein [Providencia stuartii]
MQALISLTYRDGVIPFGAIAKLVDDETNEENTSIVGDNGQLYMSGLPDSGTLLIQWGNSHSASCGAHYSHLKDIAVTEDNPIRKISLACQ